MAGIASLILSMQGKGINPHEIDSRIASSSTPSSNHTGNGILDSVCHQGGSLINAWCGFPPIRSPRMTPSTSTERNPSPLSTRANMPFHVLLITSLLARLSLLKNTMYLIIGLYDPFLALRFCLSRLTFQFQVKFRAPSDLDELTLPVCLGFVMISHTIPYYGVGAALKKRPVLTAIRKTLPYPHNQLAYDAYSQNVQKQVFAVTR